MRRTAFCVPGTERRADFPFWHQFADSDTDALGIPVSTLPFIDTVAQGLLPNVSFVDPAFDTEGNGTSAEDHPLADVDHAGDSPTPTDGQLLPNYQQLGFRVPAIVVSNLTTARVVHRGPFEHTSTLKLIESAFGVQPLTARDANAENLGLVLDRSRRRPVPAGAIPTSSQVPGRPATPPRSAAPVASNRSLRSQSTSVPTRPKLPRCSCRGCRPAPEWTDSAASTERATPGRRRTHKTPHRRPG